MAKLLTFFLFVSAGLAVLGSVMQGSGGLVATDLTAAVDDAVTTIPVTSTVGFPGVDYIIIDNEKILYAGTTPVSFTGCTRGHRGTEATAHADNAHVYIFESGMINQMAGYNITAVVDQGGILMTLRLGRAVLALMVNAIGAPFQFLGTELALFAYFYMTMGIGLLVTMAMWIFGR